MPRKRSSTHRIPHAGGYLTRNTCGSWTAELTHDYRTTRKTFPTRPPAEGWLEQTSRDHAAGRAPLTDYQQFDARTALNMLPPGVTLTQAADAWLRNAATAAPDAPHLREAIELYIQDKRTNGRRIRTLKNTREILYPLLASLDDVPLHTITTEQIEHYIHTTRGGSAESRKTYLAHVRAFLAWTIRRNWLTTDPSAPITRPTADATMPEYLTIAQVHDILTLYRATPHLMPIVLLGLFAGLRSAEIWRLDAADISDDYILVSSAAAKIRQHRYVTLLPTLAAWLHAYPPAPGPIATITQAKFAWIHETAKITWPRNCMRHTYATYHLAMWQDPGMTAHQLGHADQTQLYRHYRGLATQAQATEFWALRP